MDFNFARLAFAGLWLMLGVAMLLRDSVGLDWLSERYAAGNLNLGGGLAIAFAGWNAVRWYSGRRARNAVRRKAEGPLAPKADGRPFEYNPELDFHKPDGPTETPESK